MEDLRREERQPGELQRLAFGERVAELQHAVVGNADDVAGDRRPRASSRRCDRNDTTLFVRSSLPLRADLELHAALEASRAHAHERDAVAVRGIHVRLDLEDDAGELLLGRARPRAAARASGPAAARARSARRALPHAEVVDGRAEEDRRLPAGEESRRGRTRGEAPCTQLDLARAPARTRRRSARRIAGLSMPSMTSSSSCRAVLAGAEDAHAVARGCRRRRRSACPCRPAR